MLESALKWKRLDKRVYRISGLGVYRHLFLGDETSVLLDTGYGLVNIKKAVEERSESPITVVNTHFHPDHSGGNYRFKKVYIHESEVPFQDNALALDDLYRTITTALYEKNPKLKMAIGPVVHRLLKPRKGLTKYVPVEDGHNFDLGDRKLVLRLLPGHTEGSCVLLDPERHTIFTGDAVNTGLWLWTNPGCTLAEYADGLRGFYEEVKEEGYEKLYCCHTPSANRVSFLKWYADFVGGLRQGDELLKFHLPGYPEDPLCVAVKPTLKHGGAAMCFYFFSQAREPSEKEARKMAKKVERREELQKKAEEKLREQDRMLRAKAEAKALAVVNSEEDTKKRKKHSKKARNKKSKKTK